MARSLPCNACGAQVVESLLFCAECGAPTPANPGPAEKLSLDNPHVRTVQDALGQRFQLESVLGKGGFGVVFAARDVVLDRRVAIKVLRPGFDTSPEMSTRFLREAAHAAGVTHPHLVPIYDYGSREGCQFIVMPLIRGQTLRATLKSAGALRPQVAREILIPIASALGAIHQAGMIHRDVKPENIMLEEGSGHPWLMDFGVARRIVRTSGSSVATGSNMIVGTPHYMSPEQVSGDPVDGRADIYSLGISGFEMLAGKPPFTGTTPLEILAQHATKPLPPLPPDTPDGLRRAIVVGCEKDQSRRWASTAEFVLACREGSGRGDEADSTGTNTDTHPRARNLRYAIGSAIILVATLSVLSGLRSLLNDRSASPDQASAGPPWVRLGGLNTQVWLRSLGDSALAYADGREGLRFWVGRGATWTAIAGDDSLRRKLPPPFVAENLSPPFAFRGKQYAVLGGLAGGMPLWPFGRLVRIDGDRLTLGDSLPLHPSSVWAHGDTLVLVSAGGKAVSRIESRPWTDEATGSNATFGDVFGRGYTDLWAIGTFATNTVTDSLFRRQRGGWSVQDPRRGREGLATYDNGTLLDDGSVVVLGSLCKERDCTREAFVLPSGDSSWSEISLSKERGFRAKMVAGPSKEDFYVLGSIGHMVQNDLSERQILVHVAGGVPVSDSIGGGVDVASLLMYRGAPLALRDDGTFWARKLGKWEASGLAVPPVKVGGGTALPSNAYLALDGEGQIRPRAGVLMNGDRQPLTSIVAVSKSHKADQAGQEIVTLFALTRQGRLRSGGCHQIGWDPGVLEAAVEQGVQPPWFDCRLRPPDSRDASTAGHLDNGVYRQVVPAESGHVLVIGDSAMYRVGAEGWVRESLPSRLPWNQLRGIAGDSAGQVFVSEGALLWRRAPNDFVSRRFNGFIPGAADWKLADALVVDGGVLLSLSYFGGTQSVVAFVTPDSIRGLSLQALGGTASYFQRIDARHVLVFRPSGTNGTRGALWVAGWPTYESIRRIALPAGDSLLHALVSSRTLYAFTSPSGIYRLSLDTLLARAGGEGR